jgi:enediyne biosynthesis protein CalE5
MRDQPASRTLGGILEAGALIFSGPHAYNHQMTEPERNVLDEWRASAFYWEKHASTIREMFAPITEALIDAAEISKGHKVIDVAGGAGEPSLTLAEAVGAQGRVVCSDAIQEMVSVAEREARRRRLDNIEFRQSLADSLPFKDDEFDAAVCRLGVMFFPDPVAGIREMLRVVKPDGRIAFAAWSAKEFNPFFSAVTTVMSRYAESPPEDPDAPGAFRFAEPGKLTRALRAAGAVDIKEHALDFRIEAPLKLKEFWTARVEISDSLRAKTAALSPDQLTRAAQEVEDSIGDFFSGGRMSFPAQVIIASAKKPRLESSSEN